MISQPTPAIEIDPPPERHPLWPKFVAFYTVSGMELGDRISWEEWWLCFIAGVAAARSERDD